MQTPKAKPKSLELPQRKSPTTPRTAHQLKTTGSDSNSVSSPNRAGRNSKEGSPKFPQQRSTRSPITEKKCPGKDSELKSQLTQLQEDLKKTKDQLNTSELCKRKAQQEVDDARVQLSMMSLKLEESQQQLMELSASEDARIEELHKICNDRDRSWQSELEATQKQHSINSAALASAIIEIQKLKSQLEMVKESEATQAKHAESAHAELQSLRIELTETLSLVERLRAKLNNSREMEAQALELVSKSEKQLETANGTAEMLRLDSAKAVEAYNGLLVELDESRAQVNSLKEILSRVQEDLAIRGRDKLVNSAENIVLVQEAEEQEETNKLKEEMNLLKFEVGKLKSALEASETRYQEEYIQSTLQIRSAYEQVKQTKQESSKKVAELEAELKEARANIAETKAILMDKETELQGIKEENEGLTLEVVKNQHICKESELEMEVKRLELNLAEIKASLLDKETQMQNLIEEKEILRMEIQKEESGRSKFDNEAAGLVEAARASEQDALMKLGYITEEADRSNRRAARVTEQLEAAQSTNTEMEAELRRLKVQSDQWRKAAEAAALMLSNGNNGKFVERTVSLDSHYSPSAAGITGSPYSEDLNDDSPKKKNGNMLKKIEVLWKKGQK